MGTIVFHVLVTGVVLAAGRSGRMGRPKALLEFRGRSFLESILATMAQSGLDSRIVVAGPNATLVAPIVPTDVRLVTEGTGPQPIDSIRAGIRAAGNVDGILVWPIDLPHVEAGTVRALLSAFDASTPLVVPSFNHRRGHPVIWGSQTWSALLRDGSGKREGAREVARLFRVYHVDVRDAAVIDDIDTPEAYARLVLGASESDE